MVPFSARVSGRSSPAGWVERLARIGYATKGIVYLMIGGLALQAAWGSGSTEGARGAILKIADQPFGQILLALTAFGLLGYATWRLMEASLDPERKGNDPEGLVKRAGYLISGIVYLGLAFWAASLVLGSGSASGGGPSQEEWTAKLLAQPFGQWLVGLAGVVIIGAGLYHFYEAYGATFMRKYDAGRMDPRQRSWARRIGQFGLSARGVTFCLIGVFLIQAALQADPSETKGLADALQALAEQPFGPWLLALVAAGLIAYGVYCFSRARYSHFPSR